MKDYLVGNKEEKSLYIKNFKINRDKVKVLFANNDKTIVDNTDTNIDKIEKQMKKQIEMGNNNKDRIELKIVAYFVIFVFGTVIVASCMGLLEFILKSKINMLYYLIPTSIPVLISLPKIAKYEKILKDLKKSNLYIENEELFKKNVKEKPYLLGNISNKSIKYLEKGLSINNVEKIKLKDMNKLIQNDIRQDVFKFDESIKSSYQKVKK